MFEHKLSHRQQRFGKITTTAVLDKDENFLSIRVAMTSSFTGTFFVSLSEIYNSVIDIIWDEVFMVRNTIKTGQS